MPVVGQLGRGLTRAFGRWLAPMAARDHGRRDAGPFRVEFRGARARDSRRRCIGEGGVAEGLRAARARQRSRSARRYERASRRRVGPSSASGRARRQATGAGCGPHWVGAQRAGSARPAAAVGVRARRRGARTRRRSDCGGGAGGQAPTGRHAGGRRLPDHRADAFGGGLGKSPGRGGGDCGVVARGGWSIQVGARTRGRSGGRRLRRAFWRPAVGCACVGDGARGLGGVVQRSAHGWGVGTQRRRGSGSAA